MASMLAESSSDSSSEEEEDDRPQRKRQRQERPSGYSMLFEDEAGEADDDDEEEITEHQPEVQTAEQLAITARLEDRMRREKEMYAKPVEQIAAEIEDRHRNSRSAGSYDDELGATLLMSLPSVRRRQKERKSTRAREKDG